MRCGNENMNISKELDSSRGQWGGGRYCKFLKVEAGPQVCLPLEDGGINSSQ
jgi:hypothetical protein